MPSLPTNPRDADAAIMGSRFVSLGDAPFYRGSVNTGDGDTALIFASDGQLELLRPCRLVYVDATFWVVPSLFYQLRSSTPITRYNKLNTHLKYTIWLSIHRFFLFLFFPFHAFSSPAVCCRVFQSRVSDSAFFDRPAFFSLAFSVPPLYYQVC